MDLKEIQRKIEGLDQEIKEKETRIAQLDGKLESLLDQLTKEHNITTLDEADKLIKKYDDEVKALKEKKDTIEAEIKALTSR